MHQVSQSQIERLARLSEECGEVVQRASKILIHGWRTPGHDNRVALECELGCLQHAVKALVDNDDVWQSTIDRFAADKAAHCG